MLFSYKKLKEIANLDDTVSFNDVINAINSIGFEVENYKKLNNISGIKFGKVLKTYKNPNGDKLTVCEIEFNDKIRTIQTTAKNVKENDFLMAFVPGSSNGEMIFTEKKLQNIISEGMLISLNELGFNSELVWDEYKDGIFTFKKVDLNLDPIEYFELNDYIIDIKILTNRSDANSYIIMGKELAAYFKTKPKNYNLKSANFKSDFKITDNNKNILTGIEAKVDEDFSLSIQDSLLIVKSGIKLISPIVDLTNLTLILSGMPNHAYNKDNIKSPINPKIFSSNFEIIGGKTINFQNGLGIVDGNNNIISLAGVMGGEKYSVNKDTKNIIIEIGNFSIKDVRHTAKQLKLESNAFKQSSKKISLGTMLLGHIVLSNYLNNFSEIINFPEIKEKEIEFDIEYINKIAGSQISTTKRFKEVIRSLEILEFRFSNNKIIIPSYRHDINDIDDVLEEILRFYGFDNLTLHQPSINNFKINSLSNFKENISANGFQEVRTYTLISKERNIFNPFNFEKNIELETYISKEREVIRNSLSISLAEVIDYNQKRKINDISIFEIGMVNKLNRVLALATTTKTFVELKQILINTFSNDLEFKRAEDINQFHTGVSAIIYQKDKIVGWIGKISPYLNISDAYFVEVNLDVIKNKKNSFKQCNSKPLKTRDITFTINKKESIQEKIQEINSIYDSIFSIKVKDIYETEEVNKITLNIVCDENGMELIDKKYNNQ
ncbi:phenylalanine--tRNA ligase subunit beta [Mesomycoplasma molare]|uniref:Phenylalanine--tRNA ligase beta subunit n=1 Tax=Mesomycoplasma molare TaxID=171288 RepID=A0ABY5TTL5_9BACT|nr:phenylalanine--tRNA ligase subunit beta [Mesomycoplasma molare]UWD34007.1 phenylalanine--tRNA ligase subunit beta [Mesomycoplasma molare]